MGHRGPRGAAHILRAVHDAFPRHGSRQVRHSPRRGRGTATHGSRHRPASWITRGCRPWVHQFPGFGRPCRGRASVRGVVGTRAWTGRGWDAIRRSRRQRGCCVGRRGLGALVQLAGRRVRHCRLQRLPAACCGPDVISGCQLCVWASIRWKGGRAHDLWRRPWTEQRSRILVARDCRQRCRNGNQRPFAGVHCGRYCTVHHEGACVAKLGRW